MSSKYIYFRVESGPVYDFCVDLRARRDAAGERLLAWATERGADGFVPGYGSSVSGGWAINSLIFKDRSKVPTGWRVGRHRTTDGYDQYKPHQGTKAGKEIAKEMQTMEGLPSWDEFCLRFNFPQTLRYHSDEVKQGMRTTAYCQLTTARIGWTGDVFWIALPDLDAQIRDHVERGYTVDTPAWTPLDGMEPLSREHYELAIAQQKVAALEAEKSQPTADR